jgi:pimeloyl-ACP methyl ester carboxylesterase
MGGYVDIAGHATWVEQTGVGDETVLLLHGGLSSCEDLLDTVGPTLAEHYRVVAFDRRGHGRTADTDAPFHYADMAVEVLGVVDMVVGGPAHLVGFSDGGIVALLVALDRPELVVKLVTIGANFHHSGLRDLPLAADSPAVEMIADAYGRRSPDGREHFPAAFAKTETMFATEPTLTIDDLGRIANRALVIAGDDDAIRLDHTCALYEALPAGELAVVPGASHLLPLEKPLDTARLILDFLQRAGPPVTFMPIGRGPASA